MTAGMSTASIARRQRIARWCSYFAADHRRPARAAPDPLDGLGVVHADGRGEHAFRRGSSRRPHVRALHAICSPG